MARGNLVSAAAAFALAAAIASAPGAWAVNCLSGYSCGATTVRVAEASFPAESSCVTVTVDNTGASRGALCPSGIYRGFGAQSQAAQLATSGAGGSGQASTNVAWWACLA